MSENTGNSGDSRRAFIRRSALAMGVLGAAGAFRGLPVRAADGDIRQREHAPPPAMPKVAILVFEGVQIIDFAGPYEVFGEAMYDVFTVGESKAPLNAAPFTTASGACDPTPVARPAPHVVPA